MKLPIRLENAITKLYTTFHNNKLNSCNCSACAVGTMLDSYSGWSKLIVTDVDSVLKLIRRRTINQNIFDPNIYKSGYSVSELAEVELRFLNNAFIGQKGETKETQFKGLCAVVEYLCELDNIPNVMDYTKLFETENNEPKYKLTNQLN